MSLRTKRTTYGLAYLQNMCGEPWCSEYQVTETGGQRGLLDTRQENHTPEGPLTNQLKGDLRRHLKLLIIKARGQQDAVILAGHAQRTLQTGVFVMWSHSQYLPLSLFSERQERQ